MVISGNGLQPLEFTDCLLDSPEFRENLNRHEKELEKTSQQIKRIIKEVKDLLQAAKSKFLFNFFMCVRSCEGISMQFSFLYYLFCCAKIQQQAKL